MYPGWVHKDIYQSNHDEYDVMFESLTHSYKSLLSTGTPRPARTAWLTWNRWMWRCGRLWWRQGTSRCSWTPWAWGVPRTKRTHWGAGPWGDKFSWYQRRERSHGSSRGQRGPFLVQCEVIVKCVLFIDLTFLSEQQYMAFHCTCEFTCRNYDFSSESY